jgi:hypothetical protein
MDPNMMSFPSLSTNQTSAADQVETIKMALGSSKYKGLKNLTKDFAQGSLTAEFYVDSAAALFEGGAKDSNFVSFMPNLIQACPNDASANSRALSYMATLRGGAGATSGSAAPAGGAASFPTLQTTQRAPSATQQYRALTAPVAARTASARAGGRGRGGGGRAKTAWGTKASSAKLAVTPKAIPAAMSVASIASQQGPQGGTATAFMAKKEKAAAKEKQQAAAQQQSNNKKNNDNNKNKQKNELRSLAFGS